MKPFDLEAAKRGEPIVCYSPFGKAPADISFIGVRSNGDIVVEVPGVSLGVYPPHELRMKPRKRTVYLVVQRGSHAGTWTDDKAKAEQDAIERGEWCGDVGSFVVIPVEIER